MTALVFHQLFEGLSLGIRISTLPSGSRALPVILCILFAITAPIGVLLGVRYLPSPHKAASSNIFLIQAHINTVTGGSVQIQTAILTQGLMCALSAGMLIYAGAVEMLAGDFVMAPEMRQFPIWKQALGLGSLILGAAAMGLVSKLVPFSLTYDEHFPIYEQMVLNQCKVEGIQHWSPREKLLHSSTNTKFMYHCSCVA